MHRYVRRGLQSVTPAAGWRDILYVEPQGIRTAFAVVVPLLIGQALGQDAVGLLIGLGGLYVTIVDKSGARLPTLLVTIFGAFLAALAGSAVAGRPFFDIPLTFCWAFAFGLLAAYGPVAANAGFVITLVFAVAQGMAAVSPSAQWTRALFFGLGGVWSALTTLTLWRIAGPSAPEPVSPETSMQMNADAAVGKSLPAFLRHALSRHLSYKSPVLLHALRLGIVATVAVAIQKGWRLEHGHWIVITALVIVKPDYVSTRQRAVERMVGAGIGGIAAIFLAAAVRNAIALDIVLAILCVLAYSHVRRSYGTFTVFLTPFIVLMLNIGHPGDWQLALVRVGDTLVGGILALSVAVLLRPEKAAVALASPRAV